MSIDPLPNFGGGSPPPLGATPGGGGLGNRVNAVVLGTDMPAILAARKASMQVIVGHYGGGATGRILNVSA